MSVPRWGYEWELTLPQIELMQADLPHTLYTKNRGKDDNGRPMKNTKASEEVLRLQMEANRKAEERRKAQDSEGTYTVEELFTK